MPEKIFIVEPLGGLGNRMRVLSSVLWLKKKFDCRIQCYWLNNKAINASFQNLFEPISDITFVNKPTYYKYYQSSPKAKGVFKLFTSIINFLDGISFCIDDQYIYNHVRQNSLNLTDIVKPHKKIYFITCEHFGDGYSEIARFVPVAEISDKISHVCSKFTAHTIVTFPQSLRH